jgi:hypothetical protein
MCGFFFRSEFPHELRYLAQKIEPRDAIDRISTNTGFSTWYLDLLPVQAFLHGTLSLLFSRCRTFSSPAAFTMSLDITARRFFATLDASLLHKTLELWVAAPNGEY